MTRAEAVEVLGHTLRYGADATPHLLEGLRSRKGFLRQGCALALAVQKAEPGIEGVCDLLLTEPTDIWREIARAVGEIGPAAVMSLVSRLREPSDAARERIAWALAHVVARGGIGPIEAVAQGRDPTATGVVRHALDLAALASRDDYAVRGPSAPRDQTVNRAFSRQFFEAMNQVGALGKEQNAGLLSGDADRIDDDSEPLDDSDLIPSEV
jgi:HEAT repeat protein